MSHLAYNRGERLEVTITHAGRAQDSQQGQRSLEACYSNLHPELAV